MISRFSVFGLTLALALWGPMAFGEENAPPPPPAAGGDLQSQFQADLNRCSQEKQQAELCCNQPLECVSGMSPETQQQIMQLLGMGAVGAMAFMNSGDSPISPEGLTGICAALGALGSAGAGANKGGAEVCENTRGQCSKVCTQAASKWRSHKDQCDANQCPDAEFLNAAVEQFNQHLSTCSSLSANVEAMQQQQASTGNAAQMAQMCAQLASMMPASKPQQAAQEPTVIDCNDPAQATNPLCIDCKADPENKACGRPNTTNTGGMGFADALSLTPDDFNTGAGMDGLDQGPIFGDYEPKAASSGTVNGQGGGGILGGGNLGGDFGSDAPQGGGGGGYNTDILDGERGGGGYASVSAMEVDASGGFSGYGNGYAAEDLPYEGLDLKKFLPGGSMDPARRLAGALVSAGQINDKNANIFERISQRMKAVCKTNRLKDCQRGKSP